MDYQHFPIERRIHRIVVGQHIIKRRDRMIIWTDHWRVIRRVGPPNRAAALNDALTVHRDPSELCELEPLQDPRPPGLHVGGRNDCAVQLHRSNVWAGEGDRADKERIIRRDNDC